MSFYGKYPPSGGGSPDGILSINGDTTPAQLIVGGTGISVATVAGTTTVTNTAPAGATGNLTDAGTDGIVITGGTGAVNGAGTSIAQTKADSTHNGYLSSTDWSTFNGKGSGDVTGPASSTANAVVLFNGTGGKTIQSQARMTMSPTTGAISFTPTGTPAMQINYTGFTAASIGMYFTGSVAGTAGAYYATYCDYVVPTGSTTSIGHRLSLSGSLSSSGAGYGFYTNNTWTNAGNKLNWLTASPFGSFGYVSYLNNGSTTGLQSGGIFAATGSNRNIGAYMVSGTGAGTTPKNYGAIAQADQGGTSQAVGLWARIYTVADTTNENANAPQAGALLATNGDTTADVFAVYDNTTYVGGVTDGGIWNIGASGGTATHTLNGTLSGGIFASAAGAVGTPPHTFTGDLDTGLYQNAANQISMAIGGALGFNFQEAPAGTYLMRGPDQSGAVNGPPIIIRGSNNSQASGSNNGGALDLRAGNSTGASASGVGGAITVQAGSATGAGSTGGGGNVNIIAGTSVGGTAGVIVFQTSGTNRWTMGTTGNFLATTDGVGNIGTTGANRPNDIFIAGNMTIEVAGKGLKIKEGSNATSGVATLSGGAVVVSTTAVTASSRIQLTPQTLGTILRPAAVGVTARTAATSFTITSGDVTDTSTVAWVIVEPA